MLRTPQKLKSYLVILFCPKKYQTIPQYQWLDLPESQKNNLVNQNWSCNKMIRHLDTFGIPTPDNHTRTLVTSSKGRDYYPNEAASSSDGTEWGSSTLGKRALQIRSYCSLDPSFPSPSIVTWNIHNSKRENVSARFEKKA